MEEDLKAKERLVVIVCGFLSLIVSMATIISLKSSLGYLSIVHDNIFFFGILSLSMLSITFYTEKKLAPV